MIEAEKNMAEDTTNIIPENNNCSYNYPKGETTWSYNDFSLKFVTGNTPNAGRNT